MCTWSFVKQTTRWVVFMKYIVPNVIRRNDKEKMRQNEIDRIRRREKEIGKNRRERKKNKKNMSKFVKSSKNEKNEIN